MTTPVGGTAAATAAAINAACSAIEETAFLNKKFKPIRIASVPEGALPSLTPKIDSSNYSSRTLRLLQLASVALQQLSEALPPNQPLPLYLSLPEHLPGISDPIEGNFIELLVHQSGIPLDLKQSIAAPVGRTGGLHAVKGAHNYLSQPGNDFILIGGVDSYWDAGLLARLDAEDRLMVEGGVDGFFPGEGAVFLLLASDRVKANLKQPLVGLAMPGLTNEAGHRYSDEPYRGEGLAAAVTQAFSHAPGIVDAVWTSMIYDGYASKELGVALIRNSSSISPHVQMNHPADCVGDMGAAMGCALIGLITMNAKKLSKGRHHLVCCSSELARRGALRVHIEH